MGAHLEDVDDKAAVRLKSVGHVVEGEAEWSLLGDDRPTGERNDVKDCEGRYSWVSEHRTAW